jgi:hypothetical protein
MPAYGGKLDTRFADEEDEAEIFELVRKRHGRSPTASGNDNGQLVKHCVLLLLQVTAAYGEDAASLFEEEGGLTRERVSLRRP